MTNRIPDPLIPLFLDVKPGTIEPIDEQDVEKALQLLLKEKNDHFDNLYEKAKLYKETFVEIVFDHIEYIQYDEEQSWLEQYGLIKNVDGDAVVANNIYKAIHVKAFFKEARADNDLSLENYELPGNRLDMKRILLNFGSYISQIGVKAFYAEEKPYEKTGAGKLVVSRENNSSCPRIRQKMRARRPRPYLDNNK